MDEKAPVCNNPSKTLLHPDRGRHDHPDHRQETTSAGVHLKSTDRELATQKLPEYLEADEVAATIKAADHPRARLLMLEQWRVGLRVSEALALEVSDLSLEADNPMLRVRSGKGRRARVVPVHPELAAAFRLVLSYGTVSDGRLVDVHRSTVWRWVQTAVKRAKDLGAIPVGRRVGTHSAAATLDTC